MAARYDLEIEQGASFARTFKWFQPDGTTPLSFTGYQARAQIRSMPGETLILSLTSSPVAGLSFGSGDHANELYLSIGATATALIAGSSAYDLELYSPSNVDDVIRLVSGLVRLAPAVTL